MKINYTIRDYLTHPLTTLRRVLLLAIRRHRRNAAFMEYGDWDDSFQHRLERAQWWRESFTVAQRIGFHRESLLNRERIEFEKFVTAQTQQQLNRLLMQMRRDRHALEQTLRRLA